MLEGSLKDDDPVNHPKHYTTGNIEVIDFLEDQGFEFHEANAVKYISRAMHKGSRTQDLKKAVWYLLRKIEKLEGKKEDGGKPETTNSR